MQQQQQTTKNKHSSSGACKSCMDACMNEDTIRKVCMTDGWMRVIDVKCLKNKHKKNRKKGKE